MNITLFGSTHYDRSAKARWLLAELKIEHADKWLNLEAKEHEGEEYLRVNPLGRIPAMQIEGKAMFESGALCAYLADRFIEGKMAPHFAAEDRLEYQQWMYFAAATIDPFVSRMMIIEDIPAGDVFNAKESVFLSEVTDACVMLNQTLAKKDYLLSSGFSAADICVGYHLYICMLWPELKSIVEEYPHLTAYMDRLKKRPNAVQTKVFSYED